MLWARVLCFSIITATISTAGPPPTASLDIHLSNDPAHNLYRMSAFAHGHRHGYEEGFHAGDLDLQLGHKQQVSAEAGKTPRAEGYDPRFGSRENFRRGYEAGYRAGYLDSYFDRNFNAPAASLGLIDGPDFDRGVRDGYVSRQAKCEEVSASYCSGLDEGLRLAQGEHHEAPAVAGLTAGKN